ncbi:MAG: NRDE family protein [Pseudomonadota bacterium]
MCLLVVAYGLHPRFDLVVGANRDERHDRASAPLDRWPEFPGLVAGRDLVAGGSWMGVDAQGRFAAVTNFRDEEATSAGAPSRGRLVMDFLTGSRSPAAHLQRLASQAADYAGFSLLVADRDQLWYASNRAPAFARQLAPGVYGLSNHLLDTPWPKVQFTRQGLRALVDAGNDPLLPLFDLLAERQTPAMPSAAPLPWPATSGPFIAHDRYGTRCSTIVTRDAASTRISERGFLAQGVPAGHTQFHFASSPGIAAA